MSRARPSVPPLPPPASRPGRWRIVPRLLGRAFLNAYEDRVPHLSAAISYYALFAMFPLTLLAVAIFGIVLRNDAVQDRVLASILGVLPVEDASISEALRGVARLGPTLTIVSALGSLWTAAALSSALRAALNVIFNVEEGRPYLRGKAVDVLLLPVLGIPFIGSVAVTAIWQVLQRELSQRGILEGPLASLWATGALTISPVLTFISFLAAYWLLPNRRVRVVYLWPGALVAAVGFEGLKFGFAALVHAFANFDAIYGPLASAIVLLWWVYLTANVVLYGAEVAAEVPRVLHEEPRHGGGGGSSDWRRVTLRVLRGLVVGPSSSDNGPTQPRASR